MIFPLEITGVKPGSVLIETRDEFPDTWISGYLDIQAFFAIHYPDTKKVEISKNPSIQVSMISKYPCIQVSGYIKN